MPFGWRCGESEESETCKYWTRVFQAEGFANAKSAKALGWAVLGVFRELPGDPQGWSRVSDGKGEEDEVRGRGTWLHSRQQ